jgi:hypothetical protein
LAERILPGRQDLLTAIGHPPFGILECGDLSPLFFCGVASCGILNRFREKAAINRRTQKGGGKDRERP